MNDHRDAGIDTLSDGLVTALRTTSGCWAGCSETVRHLISGLNLVEVGQPLDSSFPEVFKNFPQVLMHHHMLR